MRSNYVMLIYIGILSLVTISCRTSKEFTYLQDVPKNQQISGMSSVINEYKVKPYDNLYVSIKTLNPEVNQLFEGNTAVSGYQAGTDQMYGSPVSQYINGYQVDSLGSISLPIIGNIEVNSLTVKQIREKIQKSALAFLKDPTVKVKLLSFKINVDGEVKNPGVYYSYNEKLNILEAISMANGVTENAEVKKAIIIRETGNGSHIIHVNLASKSLFTSDGYYLQPNDMVYISPGRNKKFELNSTSYSLLLATVTTVLVLINFFK